jgi:hypothetical protein
MVARTSPCFGQNMVDAAAQVCLSVMSERTYNIGMVEDPDGNWVEFIQAA